jgi:hypothetical protein
VKKLQGGQVSQRQVAQQSPYELLVLNEYTDFCKNSIARNPQLKGQRGSAWRPTFKTPYQILCNGGIVNLFVGTEAIAVLKRRRDIAEP